MTVGPTPRELVQRTVQQARSEHRMAQRRPQERAARLESVAHCMRLARELKRVSICFRTYY